MSPIPSSSRRRPGPRGGSTRVASLIAQALQHRLSLHGRNLLLSRLGPGLRRDDGSFEREFCERGTGEPISFALGLPHQPVMHR